MTGKICSIALILVLAILSWNLGADALSGSEYSDFSDYVCKYLDKEVVVVFVSDLPGSGRAVKAKLVGAEKGGVVMILVDDLKDSGTVMEWNKKEVYFPYSGILSLRPASQLKWITYKNLVK